MPKPRLFGSFRMKIASAAFLTTCAALLVLLSIFFVRQWTAERAQFVEQRTISANVIAKNLAAALVFRDPTAAADTLASAHQIPDFSSVSLFDNEGALFAFEGDRETAPATALAAHREQASALPGSDFLEIRAPVSLDGARVGEMVLVLGLGHFKALLWQFAVFTLLSLVFVAGAAGLLSYWVAGRLMQPIERLSDAMGQVRESGDFSASVEATSDDELGRLTGEFNALLGTLQVNSRNLQAAMEDLVRAKEVAEAASLTKSQFLANMSHEIRTPLNGVLGMAQIMALDPLTDVQRERVDIIRSSGQGLLCLLNDLLDLSKVEAGKLDLESTEFDLDKVMLLACNPFTAVARTKGIDLSWTVEEEARGVWLGDPERLRQIVSNLVSNAVKFTRQGGVSVHVKRDASDLVLAVADTGIGVPKKKIPLLFEKFSQADTSTTREFGGTGLGLSISLELARLMNGKIECNSKEGVGTTFTVRLALVHLRGPDLVQADTAAVDRVETAGVGDEDERALRILAAEDNSTNQVVLRAFLEAVGVDLVLVENGAQAVEASAAGGFDLILMDIQMPVMDGITATRAIRERETRKGGRRVPIIALTANAMSHQVSEYLAAGMAGHVAKPIEAPLLYAAINDALDGAQADGAEAA